MNFTSLAVHIIISQLHVQSENRNVHSLNCAPMHALHKIEYMHTSGNRTSEVGTAAIEISGPK